MEITGYIKSQKKLTDGTEIFFPKDISSYNRHEYETFIDKYGYAHEIKVNTEKINYEFNDEDILIETKKGHEWISHKIIDLGTVRFQINLNKYCVFRSRSFQSDYLFIKNLISGQLNPEPIYFDLNRHSNALEKSGYYPLYEHCFSSGTNCNHSVPNFIPDRVFFNFPDRVLALERIDGWVRKTVFDNIDYVNISDIDLMKFIKDRFDKRIKLQRQLRLTNSIIN